MIEVYPKNGIVHDVKIRTPKTELVRSVQTLMQLHPEENELSRENELSTNENEQ